jgi:hypothetical protein
LERKPNVDKRQNNRQQTWLGTRTFILSYKLQGGRQCKNSLPFETKFQQDVTHTCTDNEPHNQKSWMRHLETHKKLEAPLELCVNQTAKTEQNLERGILTSL